MRLLQKHPDGHAEDDQNYIDKIWDGVCEYYRMFKDWYKNIHWYHMIGFLVETSSNSKNLQYGDLPLIILITGKAWKPSEKELLQWSTSHPDADLATELRRIKDWFQKHPDRRKTERGMHSFVKAWLNRKICGAAVSQHGTKHRRYENAFNDFSLRQEYDFEELEADLLRISGGTDTYESQQTLDHRGPK